MAALTANNAHDKSRKRTAGRALPAAGLFVLFFGVFTLLYNASFFRHAASADDSGADVGSDGGALVEPAPEPSVPPAAPAPDDGDVFVPVRTSAVLRLNMPLNDEGCGPCRRPDGAAGAKYRFVSGSGTPLTGYSWGCDIPETKAVDDGYFSDAVFIGNSLEEGFMLYGGLNEADYFAAKSITVKNIYTEKAVKAGGEYVTIMEALGGKAYSKVYILLGLNEIHLGTETFVRSYSALIDKVRELQPGAELYIQSLTPVSKAQSESGSKFSNERIREYNRALMRLAADKEAHFVNVYEALEDGEGNLPEGSSYDGIHPYKKYYALWRDYLKTHTASEVLNEKA